ncbi:SGNH/GDSL hydrolase family protein [Agromyces sp. ISL-38]|uniref:SGNH/GDSL hydrolase family protein n=1 Tax=Agromyces sp. ISL-38 TaxID=2819107 RepID=UPI001BE50B28|nr:SGNH/GDSL hydrolase family protein [Agromyces sp. ISL-38]MBT2500642.1 SGNH/GDSL hydrolase family protein [Agromyces sp. ISL-38]MBT2516579.1 SGNH/GDSL hydrolase family protein [Streptomyces sp. ISL-90]
MFHSYVAIGDSFTEGVGDELPDGGVRGWADFVALGLAAAAREPIGYANLAIRGRKLGPIIEEQLEAAIGLRPEVISFNGGGNDMLRPRMPEVAVADRFRQAVHRIRGEGIHVLMLSGANPTEHLPLGRVFDARGARLTAALHDLAELDGVTFVDNFSDRGLRDIRYWSADKLHLNSLGHARVASNVLTALDVPVPPEWGVAEVAAAPPGPRSRNTAAYYREFVLPWIGRRLTGRSSGDGRTAKRPTLEPLASDASR